MTKTERERLARQERALCSIGFTFYEAAKLRRISLTLRRWHELECGIDSGCIERDDATGKPYWVSYTRRYLGAHDARMRSPVVDRERGALKRLGRIVADRNTRIWAAGSALSVRDVAVDAYIQTDPRGAALYILRPGDIPDGCTADSCYTRGLCVY